MLRLVVRCRRETLVFPLPEAEVTLGSSSKADLVVPFSGVSRLHARVAAEPGGVRITDAGSKNGVVSGGERVPHANVLPGESVRLGDATLYVEEGAEADDLAFSLDASTSLPTSRSVSTLSGPLDAPASALRLVREMEAPGLETPARRRRLLQKARAILDAESIFALDAAAVEAGVLESDGPLPDLGTLAAISSVARPRASVHRPACVHLPPDQIAIVARASSTTGSPLLVALLPVRPGSDVPWKRELLAFLASRLLERGDAANAPSPPAVPPPLHLPDGLVTGTSAAFSGLLASIEATVGSGLDVLLTGETGTGKELIARTIHDSGPHPTGPFVAVNCAAIPNDLLEAELFGVQKGAATGVEPRPGRFLQAHGGTLLLDEIGDLPEPLQAKLLRVVQEREVLPLGALAARRVDVRVVAATNRDLLQRMKQGLFRPDLYYRLSALQFHVPPLRDRADDLPALVLAFASRASETHGKRVRGVSRSALDVLLAHDWPGNVRELETAVHRAVLLCPSGGTLLADHFSQVKWAVEEKAKETVIGAPGEALIAPQPPSPPPPAVPGYLDLEARRNAVEKETIELALATAKGNKSMAARLLRISRNGLAARMKALAIGG